MKIDVEKSIIYRFDDTTDLSEAVLLLGEKGYFSDDKDFSDYITGTLTRVICSLEKTECPFVNRNEESTYEYKYKYFIPENKVVFKEEKKKTVRPFNSLDEFFNVTGFKLGDIVQIKKFGNYCYEEKSIFSGVKVYYIDEEFHRMNAIFGASTHSFDDLFKLFKYFKNGEWLPFGVEE